MKKKLFYTFAALAVFSFVFVACSDDETTPAPVTDVTLDPPTATLAPGNTLSLTATVLPINAANKNVSWSISDTTVATVTAGAGTEATVTAKAGGTATITVTTEEGGHTAHCAVTVNISFTTQLVIAGLTGDMTITYTDGSAASFTLDASGTTTVPGSGVAPKVIYSLSSAATGEVLIGRKGDETITLKFEEGELAFRAPVDEAIPVGTYAEFAMIPFGEASMGVSYRQEANLDMLGAAALTAAGLERQNWTPIGYYEVLDGYANEDSSFRGHFNGGGFTLSNLYINRTVPGISSGLFGFLDWNGSLSDIHVVSGSITGSHTVAAICGYNFFNSVISNCSNAANVSGIGGVYNTFTGGVGGICGNSNAGITRNCINTGNISASVSFAGGICGQNFGFTMIGIEACYNTGDVSGPERVGGITGQNEDYITSSYNTGKVSSAGQYVGGVCGRNHSVIENCYWLQHSEGPAYGIGTVVTDEPTPTNENAEPFSATKWPSSDMKNWGIGSGDEDNYWKSLGAWAAGGTPDGVNSTFPKLWWE